MKCQALQRRLIHSIELSVEKDARIAELEGLRDELKTNLGRQPGTGSALLISDLQVDLPHVEQKVLYAFYLKSITVL